MTPRYSSLALAVVLVLPSCGDSSSGRNRANTVDGGDEDARSDAASGSTGSGGAGGIRSSTGGSAQAGGVANAGGTTAAGGVANGGVGGVGGSTSDAGVCTGAVAGAACGVESASCGGPCTSACEFCNILRCTNGRWTGLEVFPAPCFDCGPDLRCEVQAEYCDLQHSDIGGVPDDYACTRMPASCAADATCQCLEAAVAADRCTAANPGELLLEHLGG